SRAGHLVHPTIRSCGRDLSCSGGRRSGPPLQPIACGEHSAPGATGPPATLRFVLRASARVVWHVSEPETPYAATSPAKGLVGPASACGHSPGSSSADSA